MELSETQTRDIGGNLVPAFMGCDPSYLPTFLGTYRAFDTHQQVLDLLFMR